MNTNSNLTNDDIKKLVSSVISLAAKNDPDGTKQLIDYAHDDKIGELFNHPDIKSKAAEIEAEIKRLSNKDMKSSKETEKNESLKESTLPLFISTRNNCFVLIEEISRSEKDAAIKQLLRVLEDPDASIDEKEYAGKQLRILLNLKRQEGGLTPDEERLDEGAEKLNGVMAWIKNNKMPLIKDAVGFLFWFYVSQSTPDILDSITNVLLGFDAARRAYNITGKFAMDTTGKEATFKQQIISVLSAFFVGWFLFGMHETQKNLQ